MSAITTAATLWNPVVRSVTTRTRRLSRRWNDLPLKSAIILLSGLIVTLAWLYQPGRQAVELLMYSATGRALLIAGAIYGSCSAVWTFWRLYLAIRYRPTPVVEEARLPRITVVVPAYNEGALVGQTLRHIAQADYPQDRLEIIAIDDGSEDDTWSHIEAAARAIGSRVTAIRCPTNRGKRWALWEGFRRGNGEVFVRVAR